MQDVSHKILLVLTVLTIVGEASTIFVWIFNPQLPLGPARSSLAVDYRIAVASDVALVALNLVALVWIFRRDKKGPLFLVTVSVVNRVVSIPIFIGLGFTVFTAWTILLVVFAYLDYRKPSKQT
jgi:hypothetical protein